MKRVWTRLIALLALAACQPGVAQERPAGEAAATKPALQAEGWDLVWADEFDKDGRPDPRNWNCDTGFIRNEELQWYQPENARCENGLLVIEGRRERKRNPDYDPRSGDWRRNREYAEYTSACLTTARKQSWRYGRFEMRGRIDTRAGLWPAFWTLGAAGRWPNGGEIDIMEYYRGMLLANVGWAARDNPAGPRRPGRREGQAWWDDLRKPIETFGDPDWSGKFHVWRMDWDERDLRLYVDDVLLKHTELKNTENRDGRSAFRQPHYVLLNLAIGGHGGDPSATTFPARFEVDYVRVYQKQGPAVTTTTTTTKPAGPGAGTDATRP